MTIILNLGMISITLLRTDDLVVARAYSRMAKIQNSSRVTNGEELGYSRHLYRDLKHSLRCL
ncbi:hypothetical protein GcC1_02055 [Golovinomyces cichoracearum]|uniref:Uncharacterized protein n=1 Tax=Golovinomyces cichoracearum TaxID=62708 RepID=A0A420HDN9_9PEZI|nr:hypothetical protein GcC1_02055 [Golovinomyces cichoracearum]